MIVIGIDDTDMPGTPGTNQLARAIVQALEAEWSLQRIVRHQLLSDPRVPCTSTNGSASIVLAPRSGESAVESLIETCRREMRQWFVPGSDPGLCVARIDEISGRIADWGRTCQQLLVRREDALTLAAEESVHLEGLGGTHGGVIGALAAVGLARDANDGRIVQWLHWPDDLSGSQTVEILARRSVEVRDQRTGDPHVTGTVDVGKHLRPNLRAGRAVVFVAAEPETGHLRAVKLP